MKTNNNKRNGPGWYDGVTGDLVALVAHQDHGLSCTLLDGEVIARGTGPDVRSAYRAAYRAMRLARYDTADLRRQVATLQRQLGHDLGQALEQLTRRIEEVQASQGDHRRARHAAAIRAHHAVRQAWRDLNDEVKALRKQVEELTEEAARQRNLAELCQRDAERLVAMRRVLIAARADDLGLAAQVPDPVRDPEGAMKALIAQTQRAAEYHRRATAAEARAEQAIAGQRSLIEAADKAGLKYMMADGIVSFGA